MSGISIGELVGTISLNDQFSGPVNNVAKALGITSESFQAITGLAGGVAGAIVGATGAIVALGTRGAAVDDVRGAFEQLTRSAGSTADVMLGALQTGTLGTISNFDLMKMANTAMGSGLVTSAKDMGTLAAGAKLLADRTGGDTAQAFDTLTEAMAKGKTGALKQLGVFVDNKVALEQYAASVHKSVGDLTDHERATALSQAGLAALRKELVANGPPVADFADLVDRGKVALQNFADDMAVAVANSPVVRAGMEAIGQAIEGAFGGNQQQTIKTITGYVNDFAIFLVQAAQVAVETGRFIVNAFEGSKVIFNGFLELLFDGVGKAAGVLADLADKAASLPKVGQLFTGVASGLRTTADFANSLAFGFGEMKDKALDSAASSNAAFDAVQAGLGKTETAMRAAASAEVDLTKGANTAATGLRDTGDAAGLTAAQLKAMEDATIAAHDKMLEMSNDVSQKFKTLQDDLTLANLTGTEARLFEIQQAHDKELAGLQFIAFSFPELYDQITAMVEQKYQQMTAAAQGHFSNVELAAAAAGFTTRAEMEHSADVALETYNQMLASGKFTAGELKKAWEAYLKKRDELEDTTTLSAIQKFELLASSASTILRSLFGKNKAAAIAAAVIDTAAAIVKTLAAYPFPFSLIPAAAAAAAGYAQIAKINSMDASFATGTPGTMFEDFGRGTAAMLHGHEAVVTPKQASSVAEMVSDALTMRDDRATAELQGLREDLSDQYRLLPVRLRDAFAMGMA